MEKDIDQNLLLQFSCMGTTDKDELVNQMQAIVGYHLTSRTAYFFLEMNNWNLQGAVGSYFDANHSKNLPSMMLLRNYSVVEEETRVHPGTPFWKSWDVLNTGEEPWPSGCCLVFSGGRLMAPQDSIPVFCLPSGCRTTLRIDMVAPDQPGIYDSKWRMTTSAGSFFGDVIWVIVTVTDQSLSDLTQQLSSLSSLGSPPRSASAPLSSFNNASQPKPQSGVPSNTDEDGNNGNMLC